MGCLRQEKSRQTWTGLGRGQTYQLGPPKGVLQELRLQVDDALFWPLAVYAGLPA